MLRRIGRIASALALAIALAAGWVAWDYSRFMASPLNLAKPRLVRLRPGMSLQTFGAKLVRAGVLRAPRDARYLDWYARVTGAAARLKAGEYRLKPGLKPKGLVALLVSGQAYEHRLTVVEGWTFRQMMQAVENAPAIKHTLQGDTGAQVMEALGHPDQSAEGRFFPDTYYFPRGTTDIAFLRRAFGKMQRVLAHEWQGRASSLPFGTPDKALILASIIQKETAVPAERTKVAGVFVRRLKRGMRLQADPTVIYGLGSAYNGDITTRDLRTDTPYNTYRHSGLPPTPICLPGKAAIHAALHPQPGNALYFVATGNGTHVFSDTLAQHDREVEKYQLHGH
ncbi:MAG TPA: endolytic transglycosylase MltG [Gammaproteobacteria bacterium]|nr:endolytic transglycosylase MltG [Gammaproteobacteria bacterium]